MNGIQLTNAGYFVSGGMLRDRIPGTSCLAVEEVLRNPDMLDGMDAGFTERFWHYYEMFLTLQP